MWRCKKCGCDNYENLNYCSNCGRPKVDKEPHRFSTAIALSLTCVLVFAVSAVWFVSSRFTQHAAVTPVPETSVPITMQDEEIHETPAASTELLTKIEPPVIIIQPQSTSLSSEDSYTLSVIASSPDNGSLSYQWLRAFRDSISEANPIPGATNPSYSVTHPEETSYYWVCIWNTKNGVKSEGVYSICAQVKVTIPSSPTAQPEPTTIYGKALRDSKEKGVNYSFIQKINLITDSYTDRIGSNGIEVDGKTNSGYSSKGYQDNKYGFYFADGDLYYAEAREEDGTVQLYYWDGQIIAARDLRGYETEMIAEGDHFQQIASNYAWLYPAACEMPAG